MAMVVKNNMQALNTLNTLNSNTNALTNSLKKVSSGMKINGAADDASGYAISERMRVQIRSLDQAKANTQNGSSMMKTAEGAVSSTVEILKTLKEKAINAANDSNTDEDRQTIQKELNQSIDQINDNANVTFNGKYLVDGSKNNLGKATYTSLTNQSLATDTKASDALTSLKSRSGDSLNIALTDTVTVSYVQAGKTFTASFKVADEDNESITLQDVFTKAEAIDDSSKIFADSANRSVVAAEKGVTPTAADIDAAKAARDAADGTLTAKENAVTTARTNLATAVTDLATAESEEAAAKEALDTAAGTLKEAIATYNASEGKDIAWDDSKSTLQNLADLSTDSDFRDAAAKTSGTDAQQAINKAITTAATGVKDTLAAYNGATYDGKSATDIDALDVSTGGAVKDTKDAKDDVDDAKEALATAKAELRDVQGKLTAVVSSENVGLAASDAVVTTASGQKGISIVANNEGVTGQISGLTISISDADGNVKKSANAAFDAFSETIRAQNKSADNAITLQVGAKANQSIKVGLTDMRAEALGLQGADGTKLNISTQDKANAAISVLESAIQKALDQQTSIGSVESRLEYTAANLTTASENVTASESTIRDADMAKEMTEYTKNNVLMQAAQSMLAQANQNSSNVLSLLQ